MKKIVLLGLLMLITIAIGTSTNNVSAAAYYKDIYANYNNVYLNKANNNITVEATVKYKIGRSTTCIPSNKKPVFYFDKDGNLSTSNDQLKANSVYRSPANCSKWIANIDQNKLTDNANYRVFVKLPYDVNNKSRYQVQQIPYFGAATTKYEAAHKLVVKQYPTKKLTINYNDSYIKDINSNVVSITKDDATNVIILNTKTNYYNPVSKTSSCLSSVTKPSITLDADGNDATTNDKIYPISITIDPANCSNWIVKFSYNNIKYDTNYKLIVKAPNDANNLSKKKIQLATYNLTSQNFNIANNQITISKDNYGKLNLKYKKALYIANATVTNNIDNVSSVDITTNIEILNTANYQSQCLPSDITPTIFLDKDGNLNTTDDVVNAIDISNDLSNCKRWNVEFSKATMEDFVDYHLFIKLPPLSGYNEAVINYSKNTGVLVSNRDPNFYNVAALPESAACPNYNNGAYPSGNPTLMTPIYAYKSSTNPELPIFVSCIPSQDLSYYQFKDLIENYYLEDLQYGQEINQLGFVYITPVNTSGGYYGGMTKATYFGSETSNYSGNKALYGTSITTTLNFDKDEITRNAMSGYIFNHEYGHHVDQVYNMANTCDAWYFKGNGLNSTTHRTVTNCQNPQAGAYNESNEIFAEDYATNFPNKATQIVLANHWNNSRPLGVGDISNDVNGKTFLDNQFKNTINNENSYVVLNSATVNYVTNPRTLSLSLNFTNLNATMLDTSKAALVSNLLGYNDVPLSTSVTTSLNNTFTFNETEIKQLTTSGMYKYKRDLFVVIPGVNGQMYKYPIYTQASDENDKAQTLKWENNIYSTNTTTLYKGIDNIHNNSSTFYRVSLK